MNNMLPTHATPMGTIFFSLSFLYETCEQLKDLQSPLHLRTPARPALSHTQSQAQRCQQPRPETEQARGCHALQGSCQARRPLAGMRSKRQHRGQDTCRLAEGTLHANVMYMRWNTCVRAYMRWNACVAIHASAFIVCSTCMAPHALAWIACNGTHALEPMRWKTCVHAPCSSDCWSQLHRRIAGQFALHLQVRLCAHARERS